MRIVGHNLTLDKKIEISNTFPLMKFSLLQGAGAELIPCVKVGDRVKIGTIIAKPKENMLGVNLHSSVSGSVVKIEKEELDIHANGQVVYVQSDNENERENNFKPLEDFDLKKLCKHLDMLGVVDFDCISYPISAKLEKFADKKLSYIFVNVMCSDAYITTDIAVLRERAYKILRGIKILQSVLDFDFCVFVLPKDYKKCFSSLDDMLASETKIYSVYLKNKIGYYDDKAIINSVLGVRFDESDNVIESGYLCLNVQCLVAIADAVDYGLPCITRIIACSGKSICEPMCVEVKIGTTYEDLLEFAGGEKFSAKKYKQLKESATDLYSNYLQLREEFKEDESDEEVKAEMVDARKKSNDAIMEFLKADNLHRAELCDEMLCGGGALKGTAKDNLMFAVTKSTQGLLMLTRKESVKLEKIKSRIKK